MVRRIGLLVIGLLLVTAVTSAQVTRTQRLSASERVVIGANVFGTTSPLQVVGLPAKTSQTACAWLDGSGNVFTGACPTGTVTSVGLSAPAELTVSGSPVTGSGTLALAWASAAANSVFQRAGTAGTPSFSTSLTLGGSLQAATGILARTTTTTDGYVAMYQGSSGNIGYVAWHEPTTGTRQGYLGWGSSNINMTFEDNAHFRVNGMLWADELHVKSFTADLEQALAGGQIIAKSVAVVAQDFSCPAAGGTTTLYVRDLPSMANTAAFETTDWVVLRTFSRSSGTLSVAECVGQVSSYADQSGANEGQQSWTFTRGTSTCAGGWTSGTITVDSLAIDYGASGNGYHQIDAASGAYNVTGPFAQIVTWTTCPIAANRVTQAKWGQLNGTYGYSTSTFGFAAGPYTGNAITVDPTNGIRMLNNGTVLGQWSGSTLTLGQPLTVGSTGQIQITSSAINMRWRNSSNTATTTVFSVDNSTDAGGQANVTGNLYVTGVVRVPTLSNPSGDLTLSAANTGSDIVVSLNGGQLRPYVSGTYSLGDVSYTWATVYTDLIRAGASATLKLMDGGAWYVDGTYQNTLNCNYGADSNQACWINYRGYNGGTTRFRDLYIGDGKGGTMLQVDGVNARVGINKSAPSYTLDVNGAANATSYRVGGTAGVSGTCASVTVTNGIVTTCTP